MKLATKHDIEAPISQVWAVMSDFEGWERSAMRRGVDVSRTDNRQSPGVGMTWLARFLYRGKNRKVEVKLTEMTGPGLLAFDSMSTAIEVVTKLELFEMSAKRTRIHVALEVKPRTLGARLFLQSLRLARGKVDRKFETKVGQFATELEQRLRAAGRRA